MPNLCFRDHIAHLLLRYFEWTRFRRFGFGVRFLNFLRGLGFTRVRTVIKMPFFLAFC